MKGTILYATRYGSTLEVCQWIRQGMTRHEARVCPVSTWREDEAEFFILGSPIFVGKPHPDMINFLNAAGSILHGRPTAVFITSWAESTPYRSSCRDFLDLMRYYLAPCVPFAEASLPGRLLMEEISPRDRRTMQRLLRRIDRLSPDFHSENIAWQDVRSAQRCREFGRQVDRLLGG